jgi:hypothetical protein
MALSTNQANAVGGWPFSLVVMRCQGFSHGPGWVLLPDSIRQHIINFYSLAQRGPVIWIQCQVTNNFHNIVDFFKHGLMHS